MVRGAWRFALGSLLLFAGCPKPQAPTPKVRPDEGTTLKLVIVDDPAMAKSVSQLRSEWKARSGGELQVIEAPLADALTADAIIYPSSQLGELVESKRLEPVPKDVLDSSELAWPKVFELLTVHDVTWGGEVYALPLGSPVFTLMYRADVLERLGKKPPTTWAEYQSLAKALKSESSPDPASTIEHENPEVATIEPLAPGWAGKVLLARAACYAKHRDNYSALFRIDTMEPLISGPPFVRALEELVAASKLNPETKNRLDPNAARREVLAGRSAMALTWASAANADNEPSELPTGARIAFHELPGSEQVYNVGNNSWEKRAAGEPHVMPLVSISGRLASVLRTSQYQAGAFRLIAWLSGPEWSTRVASVSPATTLYRNSHLKSPKDWVDANLDASAAVQYGETVQEALTRSGCLSVPRIPGHAEYMAALDEAVYAAVEGTSEPKEALAITAQKWKEITDRLGLEKQRSAYQRSFGLNL